MNKKHLLIIFLAFFMSGKIFGQTDPYYTHFFLNKLSYNGASAGSNDAICANLLGHKQWAGFTNTNEIPYYQTPGLAEKAVGPTTLAFNVSSPVKIDGGQRQIGAAGLSIVSDRVGFENSLNINLSLAYMLNIGSGKLHIAVSPGILQKGYDGKYYNPLQPNDPLVPAGSTSERGFDLGAGLYYSNPSFNNFYAGISATHLTQPTFNYQTITSGSVNIATERHLYIMAGNSMYIGNGNTIFQPNILIKKDPTILQFDLNARFILQEQIVVGLTYRNGGTNKILETFSPQFGYYISPTFYIGYAYDLPLVRPLSSGGSHEIVATYCFKLPGSIPPTKLPLRSPRFLGGYR